ncbi:MAG: tetratricopeptide repeat protein [Verrucomicrobia bacterium]|nr:tetratricopeptide repeat protein [Verrucomicrobiota bacterium]MBU1910151.1 tetratricopeptide repeat protein [Verrucomicrobiota bacterium]
MAEEKAPVGPGAEAPPPQTDVDKLHSLWREYGQPILIGLGLAAAFLLGFGAYRTYRQNSVLKAGQLLARAGTIEQLQQVVSQYPSTPSAPLAVLTMAARQYDAGQFEMAQYTYTQFEQKYPKHPMKTAAELGRAQCLEAAGNLDQAQQAFEAFVASRPDDYLVPLAQLGKARVLAQADRLEDARTAYEDFIAANPESGWIPMAENALEQVNRLIRAPRSGAAPTAPMVAVPNAPAVTIPEAPAPAPVPSATAPSR